ncbi:dihydrolipoyl dehydrogenase family protein [Corynebacterium sp. A21]|uniref:dihydrolipoyl dehydrogenase family protein n=1 Tax=Corynebacterium sp. A21 TaxID=3457318 RepID=UPI003FD60B5B
MNQNYDLIVIGFGKAGKTVAMKRSAAGDRVALIERDPAMYGGTCINIGCVPTKKLLSDTAKGIPFPEAVAGRDTLIGQLNATNLKLAESKGVTVINGEARFSGSHEVTVTAPDSEDLVLAAKTMVINTGATPVWPELPGINGPKVYDSTTIQHITPTPGHLVIVGGGPIGLEFATLFTGQGAEVTIIDSAERPLKNFDADVAQLGTELLEARNISFINNARAAGFEDNGEQVTVRYRSGEAEQEVLADAALVAIGRRPATAGLGLQEVGIELGERGEVKVDHQLRTSVPGVYAVGDVKGGPQFTYVSYDDHRIVLDHIAGSGLHSTEGRIIPTTTFLEPPLSTIGLGEQRARDLGHDIEVRKALIADMPIVPRPKIIGQPEGMAKFIINADSQEILGATLFCADSQELINTVAIAMRHGVTAPDLGRGIYTHPSTSEVFNQLLE